MRIANRNGTGAIPEYYRPTPMGGNRRDFFKTDEQGGETEFNENETKAMRRNAAKLLG